MRIIKRYLLTFFFFILLFVAVNVIRAAEPARTVKVGIYNNYPKIYQDPNGKAAGVYADLLNFIAGKENWDIQYVPGLWEEGLSRLEKGEINIMVDVAISEERKKLYDFNKETVLNSWAILYVKKDSDINSILDFEGKKISIVKSSVYEDGQEGISQYLSKFGVNATLVEVDNYSDVLNYLNMGRVDGAIVSAIFSLANQQYYQDLKTTNIFLSPSELRFALTKGDSNNKYFIEKLDYWVKKLREGYKGIYSQSLEKHGLICLEPQLAKSKTTTAAWMLPSALGVGAGLVLSTVITLTVNILNRKRKRKNLKKKSY